MFGLATAGCIDIGDIASSYVPEGSSQTGDVASSTADSSTSTSDGAGSTSSGSTSSLDATTGGDSSSTTDQGESTSSTTASDTTGLPAVCGDGVIHESEECENDSEHCVNCLWDRYVFVSSMKLPASAIGGIAGGNARCQELASAASLSNASSFRAWLSDSEMDARDNVHLSEGSRYLLPNDGEIQVVALGAEFLEMQPELDRPIDVDEYGQFVDAYVWTGTNAGGSRQNRHCNDWDTTDGNELGYFGSTTEFDEQWTIVENDYNPGGCNLPLRIYCFEAK